MVKKLSSLIVLAFAYLFTDFTTRFLFLIGSRKSAKTKHIALRIVYRILRDPEYNALAMRKVKDKIKDSIKVELEWAIRMFGVSHLFEYKKGDLEFVYKPTGQKILLRSISVDKATGNTTLSGLNVSIGWIKECWLEEAYEFTKADYKMIVQTLRGGTYTMIISMNPWIASQFFVAWAMKHLQPSLATMQSKGEMWFHDDNAEEGMGISVHWMNWMINDKLSYADIQERLREKKFDPEEYIVSGYGMPGAIEGAIFSRYWEKIMTIKNDDAFELISSLSGGIDYGDVRDATAATISGTSTNFKHKVLFDEYYHSNGEKLTNQDKPWRHNDLSDYAKELYEFYYQYWDLIRLKGGIKIKVEWAGAGVQLRKELNAISKTKGTYPLIRFIKTTKFEITDRVRFDRKLMSYGMLYIVEGSMSLLMQEFQNLKWKTSHTAEGGYVDKVDESSWANHLWDAWCYDNSKDAKRMLPDFKWAKNINNEKEEE